MRSPSSRFSRQRGSIIVLVMVTLLFTAAALVAFLDKASSDLLVDARAAQAARLRPDAYSALEVTIGVLQDFNSTDNGLRAPTEGWNDPLTWAGWTPAEGHTVDVTFQDESAKIPLIHADAQTLLNLFESVGYGSMAQSDAQRLIDGLLTWMQPNYTPVSAFSPDYEQSAIPYDAPQRSLRSMDELAAIDVVRDQFFDATGRPNALWWQFCNDFSIFNFRGVNINGANPDVLTAVGQFDPEQITAISSYLAGTSQLSTLGRKWFTSAADLQSITGPAGNLRAFAFTIRALRILITVHEGKTVYRLSAVVAPQGGATTVQTTATDAKAAASNSASGEAATTTSTNTASAISGTPTAAQTAAAASANIRFPFTILELRENDDILTPPPPPPEPADAGSAPPSPPSVTPGSTPSA